MESFCANRTAASCRDARSSICRWRPRSFIMSSTFPDKMQVPGEHTYGPDTLGEGRLCAEVRAILDDDGRAMV